jgi:hypothetical protein
MLRSATALSAKAERENGMLNVKPKQPLPKRAARRCSALANDRAAAENSRGLRLFKD